MAEVQGRLLHVSVSIIPSGFLTESPHWAGPFMRTPSMTACPPTGILRSSAPSARRRKSCISIFFIFTSGLFLVQEGFKRFIWLSAGVHLPAFPVNNAGGSGRPEKQGRCRAYLAKHFSSEIPYFPLRPPAEPESEKMMELTGIHGHNKPCGPSVRQDEPGVLFRDTFHHLR